MTERIYIPGTVDAIMHCESDGEITVEHVQDCEGILTMPTRHETTAIAR